MQSDEKAFTVVCVANEPYIQYATVLIRSIVKNAPNVRIYLHAINVPEAMLRPLRAYPSCEVFSETHRITDSAQDRAYAANSRVKVIKKLLERGDRYVMYMDADAIVRSSLGAVPALVGSNDILVARTKDLKPVDGDDERVRFLAGVLVFRNSPSAHEFVSRWNEELMPRIYEWFGEQLTFSRVFDELSGRVSIGALPFSLIDFHFEFRSTIWIGKGQKKTENALYLLEEKKYREQLTTVVALIVYVQQLFFRSMRILWGVRQFIISKILSVRTLMKG